MSGEELLKAVALKALAWLERHRFSFDPQTHGVDFDEVHATALTELALLCYLLRRQSNDQRERVERLLAFVESVYRRPAFHQSLYQNPHTLIAHLIIRLALTEPVFDEIIPLEELTKALSCVSINSTSYRALELNYLLELNGFSTNSLSANLPALLYLTDSSEPPALSQHDCYVITHSIFYLTNFGKQRIEFLTCSQQNKLCGRLDELLRLAINRRNWDLVGELVLCHRCLYMPNATLTDHAIDLLAAAQRTDGALGGVGTESVQASFLRLYHPTLVAVMAGLLATDLLTE